MPVGVVESHPSQHQRQLVRPLWLVSVAGKRKLSHPCWLFNSPGCWILPKVSSRGETDNPVRKLTPNLQNVFNQYFQKDQKMLKQNWNKDDRVHLEAKDFTWKPNSSSSFVSIVMSSSKLKGEVFPLFVRWQIFHVKSLLQKCCYLSTASVWISSNGWNLFDIRFAPVWITFKGFGTCNISYFRWVQNIADTQVWNFETLGQSWAGGGGTVWWFQTTTILARDSTSPRVWITWFQGWERS